MDRMVCVCCFLNLNILFINSLLCVDEGGIPSQFPVQEDTQFCQILRESLDFFGIDEKFHNSHVLVDYKSREDSIFLCL